MIDLAIIPARGGSKRLPNKNLRMIGGKPMIVWTIAAALSSKCFKRVMVSTDDELIARAAKDAGADIPFIRPEKLATDSATTLDVVLHALEQVDTTDSFALLQPTSPLRTAEHLKHATKKFYRSGADALISVSVGKPASWLFEINSDGKLSKLLNSEVETHSQNAVCACLPNGAIYIYRTSEFLKNKLFIPPNSSAFEMSFIDSIDIDDFDDFQLVEAVIANGVRLTEIRE